MKYTYTDEVDSDTGLRILSLIDDTGAELDRIVIEADADAASWFEVLKGLE